MSTDIPRYVYACIYVLILCLPYNSTFCKEDISGKLNIKMAVKKVSKNRSLYYSKVYGAVPSKPFISKQSKVSAYGVIADNKYATESGLRILNEGGSASDAVIAMSAVLNVVEPQLVSLLGNGIILHYNSKTRDVQIYSGLLRLPGSFEQSQAKEGFHMIGIPGIPYALNSLHNDHGILAIESLLADAISLAKNGFIVSPAYAFAAHQFTKMKVNVSYMVDSYLGAHGEAYDVGSFVQNNRLKNGLKTISNKGFMSIYSEDFAKRAHLALKYVSVEDFVGFSPVTQKIYSAVYKNHIIYSGYWPTIVALKILNLIDIRREGFGSMMSPNSINIISNVVNIASAYAEKYLYGDNEQIINAILDDNNILNISTMINSNIKQKSYHIPIMGAPLLVVQEDKEPKPKKEKHDELNVHNMWKTFCANSASNMVAFDRFGNLAIFSSSIGHDFASMNIVDGFIISNGVHISNQRAKYLRSHKNITPRQPIHTIIGPAIVLDKDKNLVAAVASSSGSDDIFSIVNAIVGIYDMKLSAYDTAKLPNYTTDIDGSFIIHLDSLVSLAPNFLKKISSMGYNVKVTMKQNLRAGVSVMQITDGKMMIATRSLPFAVAK